MKIFFGFALLTVAIGQSPTTPQDPHGSIRFKYAAEDMILYVARPGR